MPGNTARAGSTTEPALAARAGLRDGVRLWLVRHGETEWSRDGRHTGRTDLPLTSRGEDQARAAITLLERVDGPLEHPYVLCSPRLRARQTARLAGLAVDGIDEDLAEWDYGDYEGRTTAEIRVYAPGWTLWRDGVPGGETIAQVSDRADRVLARVRSRLAERPVVLVAHGHISRVLAARWIGLPAAAGGNLLLSTAAPSLLGSQYGEPVIAHWNLPNPALDASDGR
jgi:probable phosphoglycerate mutase